MREGTHGAVGTKITISRRSFATARPRPFRALFVLSALTGAFAAAVACLPNLADISDDGASFEAGTAPLRGCGDGIIETLDDGGDAGESCDPGTDASVTGCASCQITCEGELDPSSHHCYFVAGADTSYGAAATRCKDQRAHVVTFSSDDEVARVGKVALDPSGYWIGLARSSLLLGAYQANRTEEPGFPYPLLTSAPSATGPCPGCYGVGADAGVFPLADVDASDTLTDTSCVASRSGAWFRVPCNSGPSRATVCEREPSGARAQDCVGGFCFSLPQTRGDKTYLVVVSAADPETAAQNCGGLDRGSLVVLETSQEREQLAHEIVTRYPDESQQLWIGLVQDGGTWVWEDGVTAEPSSGGRALPWGNAQPEGGPGARAYLRVGAAAYDTQLAYAGDGTKARRLYVCQRPAQ